jgi:hypothetical protein
MLLLTSALFCRAEEAVSGRWEGSVQIPGRELRLIVDLSQGNGTAWVGSIIMPDLNLKGVPLTDLGVNNASVSFAIKNALDFQATVKTHLNADGALAGDFVQAGNSAPILLKKIGPSQVELPPHSTVVTKDFVGEWRGQYEFLGYPRKVTLKLANHGSDGATAEFVVVGKKVNNLPVDLITQESDFLTINVSTKGMSYEGRLQKGELKGTFAQGGTEIPLVLRRTQ